MLLYTIPLARIRLARARAIAGRLASGRAAVALLLLAGCGDSSGPNGGGGGTLSGTVRSAGESAVLEGATVSVATGSTTSDASGHYELTALPVGTATVRAQRAGYLPAEATVTISSGANTHDFALTVQEIFHSGPNAVYVPGGVGPVRGVIVVLGGPVTSGFVTGDRIAPPDSPDLERSLQQLGTSLRVLAKSAHVALLGSATIGMASSAASDATLFAALRAVAGASGHPEVADAPVLMFGLSAGAREAAGLVSRNPERAIGLLVRVPVSVTDLTAPAVLAVPTFVMQAELDAVVDNTTVRATFADNRSRGGLWALAVEPKVAHNVATDLGNQVAIEWISTALTQRIPGTSGDPLIALDPASGWLGNQTTLEIAPWADYPEDRTRASWLLSPDAAMSWQLLGTVEDPGGFRGRAAAALVPTRHFDVAAQRRPR